MHIITISPYQVSKFPASTPLIQKNTLLIKKKHIIKQIVHIKVKF